MIKIVSYGSGNIEAIANIYKRLGIPCSVASVPEDLTSATRIILPGVGAFDETMKQLTASGLRATLDELVLEKRVPVMGICVGMQILALDSEEGELPGLGWINGHVKKIDASRFTHKPHLPHMGWNSITPTGEASILKNIDYDQGFYFLHSYYFACNRAEDILCQTEYGSRFTSGVHSENIFGMQFHPEKSHNNGIQLLKNFAEV